MAMTDVDPLAELLAALERDGKPPDGCTDAAIVEAWATSLDGWAMADLLARAGRPLYGWEHTDALRAGWAESVRHAREVLASTDADAFDRSDAESMIAAAAEDLRAYSTQLALECRSDPPPTLAELMGAKR